MKRILSMLVLAVFLFCASAFAQGATLLIVKPAQPTQGLYFLTDGNGGSCAIALNDQGVPAIYDASPTGTVRFLIGQNDPLLEGRILQDPVRLVVGSLGCSPQWIYFDTIPTSPMRVNRATGKVTPFLKKGSPFNYVAGTQILTRTYLDSSVFTAESGRIIVGIASSDGAMGVYEISPADGKLTLLGELGPNQIAFTDIWMGCATRENYYVRVTLTSDQPLRSSFVRFGKNGQFEVVARNVPTYFIYDRACAANADKAVLMYRDDNNQFRLESIADKDIAPSAATAKKTLFAGADFSGYPITYVFFPQLTDDGALFFKTNLAANDRGLLQFESGRFRLLASESNLGLGPLNVVLANQNRRLFTTVVNHVHTLYRILEPQLSGSYSGKPGDFVELAGRDIDVPGAVLMLGSQTVPYTITPAGRLRFQIPQSALGTLSGKLTIGGIKGSTTLPFTLTIASFSPPTITFTAQPASVNAGERADLCWNVSGATKAYLQEADRLIADANLPTGCLAVYPAQSTVFFLQAEGLGGTASQQVQVTVRPFVPPPQEPEVTMVTDWYTGGTPIPRDTFAPGALITIRGKNLGPDIPIALQPLIGSKPNILGGATAHLNCGAQGAGYVRWFLTSPNQLNVQLPTMKPDRCELVVTNHAGKSSRPVAITLVAARPNFQTYRPEGKDSDYLAVFRADGSQVTAENQPLPGEEVSFYLTGLGDTNPWIPEGEAGTGAALVKVEVYTNGVPAELVYAGREGQVPGVDRITVRLPLDQSRLCAVGTLINGESQEPFPVEAPSEQ